MQDFLERDTYFSSAICNMPVSQTKYTLFEPEVIMDVGKEDAGKEDTSLEM